MPAKKTWRAARRRGRDETRPSNRRPSGGGFWRATLCRGRNGVLQRLQFADAIKRVPPTDGRGWFFGGPRSVVAAIAHASHPVTEAIKRACNRGHLCRSGPCPRRKPGGPRFVVAELKGICPRQGVDPSPESAGSRRSLLNRMSLTPKAQRKWQSNPMRNQSVRY